MSHSFENKTFTQLTYCNSCRQLLWGVIKQGIECAECGYVCHRKCKSAAPKCSKALPQQFLDDADIPKNKQNSVAESYLRQLKQKTVSEDSNATSHDPVRIKETRESTLSHIKAIATSEKFQNIVADAVTSNEEPINAYLESQPPLNPQITTRNFTRFVSRCGPVFAFRNELLLLLSWRNPVDTLVSLTAYCFVCFNPKLLLLVPQALLIYYIVCSYSKRDVQKKKNGQDKQKKRNSISATTSDKASTKPLEDKRPGLDTTFPFNLAAMFQPASNDSPEYLKNLQDIQNSMGEFSDLYDWIMGQSNRFNWKDEQETTRILEALLLLTLTLSVTLYFVSINTVFLFFGIFIYAVNTRFAKYIIRELSPYVLQSTKRKANSLIEWYTCLEKNLQSQSELKEISVFENQRWWPSCGYLNKMLEDDRLPWSDFSGTVYMPIITEIPAPKGYQWKESSEWKLDTIGPWVDDYLKIEISTTPDKDGWVYSDTYWKISTLQIKPVNDDKGEQHKQAMTRRRRWTRIGERQSDKTNLKPR